MAELRKYGLSLLSQPVGVAEGNARAQEATAVSNEDLEIGRHILSKGYKILTTPATIIQHQSMGKVRESAIKSGRYYHVFYDKPSPPIYAVKKVLEPLQELIDNGSMFGLYTSYKNMFFLYGMLTAI